MWPSRAYLCSGSCRPTSVTMESAMFRNIDDTRDSSLIVVRSGDRFSCKTTNHPFFTICGFFQSFKFDIVLINDYSRPTYTCRPLPQNWFCFLNLTTACSFLTRKSIDCETKLYLSCIAWDMPWRSNIVEYGATATIIPLRRCFIWMCIFCLLWTAENTYLEDPWAKVSVQ